MSQGYFITGTDTGVGKTHVTALLLAEFQRRGQPAAGFKPIACGRDGRNDAGIYHRLVDHQVSLDTINPVYLRQPLAPVVAARLEHRRIDRRQIHRAYRALRSRFQPLLVEGAGGWLVPITRRYYVSDLAIDLGLPVIIVARLGLGTINHTLLTVRAVQESGLPLAGVILSDEVGGKQSLAEKTNPDAIRALSGVPLLGCIPHGDRGAQTAAAQVIDGLLKTTAS